MKKYFLLFFFLGILSFCNKNEKNNKDLESGIIGIWKLIEVYADSGGGDGSFYPVESDKIITFFSDGTITSNGNICNLSIEANNPTSGTYSLTDSTFTSPDCINPDYNYQFEHNENTLIIIYPCFEPCQEKYKKK